MPDYFSPFTAYRAWQWDSDGLKSMNHAKWTPKVAFEATCPHTGSHVINSLDSYQLPNHSVPDENCTCGMYAGIDFQHLINIGYATQGIHGEVLLWGKLERCSLGWRAQYAYPKFFVIPPDHLPFSMREISTRLQQLIAYDVDIYLQTDREPKVGQERIPLWMKGYGWSQQGIGHLVDQRKDWYTQVKVPPPAIKEGDRISVRDKGIGIVKHVDGDNIHFEMFTTYNYRQQRKEFVWSKQNWRWEVDSAGVLECVIPTVTVTGIQRLTVNGRFKPGDTIFINGEESTVISVTESTDSITTQKKKKPRK